MDLELPEYLLLAVAVLLGVGIRHWLKSRRSPGAHDPGRS